MTKELKVGDYVVSAFASVPSSLTFKLGIVTQVDDGVWTGYHIKMIKPAIFSSQHLIEGHVYIRLNLVKCDPSNVALEEVSIDLNDI